MSQATTILDGRLNRRSLLAAAAAGGAAAAVPHVRSAQAQDISLRAVIQGFMGIDDEPLERTGQPSTFYTRLLPAYRAAHPEVELTIEAGVGDTDGRTKYLLECRQGAQADVIQLDGFWIAEFGAIGCTQPLDGLVPQSLVDDYLEPFVARYNGQIAGLITGTAFNSMLWYRKDWFEEAGLPGPPKDWNELKSYAEILTTGDRFGLAFPAIKNEAAAVINLGFYWQEQDVFVTPDNRPAYNNQTSIDVFNLLGDIYKAGWAPPDVINMGYGEVDQLFFAEQAAMILHGSFIAGTVRQQPFAEQVGLAPNPVSPTTGRRGTNAGGWGIGITTPDEEKLAAAADFVTLFAGGDQDLMLGQLKDQGYLPTQKSLADHPQFKETEWDEIILSELPFAKTRPTVEIYPDASTDWVLAFQEVMTGDKEAAAALEDAAARTLKTAEEKGYLRE